MVPVTASLCRLYAGQMKAASPAEKALGPFVAAGQGAESSLPRRGGGRVVS